MSILLDSCPNTFRHISHEFMRVLQSLEGNPLNHNSILEKVFQVTPIEFLEFLISDSSFDRSFKIESLVSKCSFSKQAFIQFYPFERAFLFKGSVIYMDSVSKVLEFFSPFCGFFSISLSCFTERRFFEALFKEVLVTFQNFTFEQFFELFTYRMFGTKSTVEICEGCTPELNIVSPYSFSLKLPEQSLGVSLQSFVRIFRPTTGWSVLSFSADFTSGARRYFFLQFITEFRSSREDSIVSASSHFLSSMFGVVSVLLSGRCVTLRVFESRSSLLTEESLIFIEGLLTKVGELASVLNLFISLGEQEGETF